MKGIIYKFTSPSGKVYIGQTTDKYRNTQHRHTAYNRKSTRPFYKAIRKYGFENFKYEILKEIECNTKEELNNKLDSLEIYYIALHNATDEKYGYNLCNGGRTNRGYHHSEEYKETLSKKLKGRKMPPGCVEKAAQNRIGKPMNRVAYKKLQVINKNRAKVLELYTIQGTLVTTFESIACASRFLKCRRSNIQNAVNKGFTIYGQYKIKIKTDMKVITVKQMAATKRVAQNVQPLVAKKARLNAQIEKLNAEIVTLQEQIDVQQGYVKSFAGGFTTEQLIVRNEDGRYEPNTEVVYFDEEKRVYVVKDADAAPAAGDDAPSEEEAAAAEEAAREAELARLEAEKQAEEEAREAEIRAAKERLSQAKPADAAPVDNDPFAPQN